MLADVADGTYDCISAEDVQQLPQDAYELYESDAAYYTYDMVSRPNQRRQPARLTLEQCVDVFTETYKDDQHVQRVMERFSAFRDLRCVPQHDNTAARDWNTAFQNLLFRVQDHALMDHELEFSRLSELTQDFVYTARTIGEIIVSEKFLPISQKTIKPTQVGGIAGGEKYVCQNILFKFAVDDQGLYGSDENAAKVAGHELLGLSHMQSLQEYGICVPLCCLIDFRGFRIVAMSMLPIQGEKTLVYGSSDAGQRIMGSNEAFNKAMENMARDLNLAPHYVTDRRGKKCRVFGPFDTEGHVGTDGVFYALDFARTFPPCPPVQRKDFPNAHLYHMFRPEFVKALPFSLSSDAFCKLSDDASGIEKERVVRAYRLLLERTIPQCAKWLQKQPKDGVVSRMLSSFIHRQGINLRYIGAIRKHCRSSFWRAALLKEAVCRTLKSLLRTRYRHRMQSLEYLSEEPYRTETVHFLNLAFGNSTQSNAFWNVDLKAELTLRFQCILSEKELTFDYCLWSFFLGEEYHGNRFKTGTTAVLLRFLELTGIQLDAMILSSLCDGQRNLFKMATPFERVHVRSMSSRIKQLPIVAYSQGTSLFVRAIRKQELGEKESDSDAKQLAELAVSKFEEVLRTNLNDYRTLCNYGFLLGRIYNDEKAFVKYLRYALRSNANHARSWYYLGQHFLYHGGREALSDARSCLSKSLELTDFKFANALKEYGVTLHRLKDTENGNRCFRQALALAPDLISANLLYAESILKSKSDDGYDECLCLLATAARSSNGSPRNQKKALDLYKALLQARFEHFFQQRGAWSTEEAKATLQQLFKIDSEDESSKLLNAVFHSTFEPDFQCSVDLFTDAIYFCGSRNIASRLAFTSFLFRTGNDQWKAVLSKCIHLSEQDPDSMFGVGLLASRLGLGHRRIRDALDLYQQRGIAMHVSTQKELKALFPSISVPSSIQIRKTGPLSSTHVCSRMIDGFPCWCRSESKALSFVASHAKHPFPERFSQQLPLAHIQLLEHLEDPDCVSQSGTDHGMDVPSSESDADHSFYLPPPDFKTTLRTRYSSDTMELNELVQRLLKDPSMD